jgi:hypothetical protein
MSSNLPKRARPGVHHRVRAAVRRRGPDHLRNDLRAELPECSKPSKDLMSTYVNVFTELYNLTDKVFIAR